MPIAMIAVVRPSTGADAALCTNGILRVRIMCTIRVWVSRLSTNQPDWKNAWCAGAFAPNQYHSNANVVMSKIELVGPTHNMKRLRSPASHLRGLRTYSSSIRSNGIDNCEMS